jgi:predicted outer membrane repeat protein
MGSTTTNPNPLGIGGAISIKQNSANILFQRTTEVAFTSNSARNGGAIYTGGIVSFECTSVVFSENVASSSGGAIFINKEDSGSLGGEVVLNSNNGDIIFTGNQAGAGDAAGHDIYIGTGRLRIAGNSGKVVINGGISGLEGGIVNKSSGGLFLLGGTNQHFRGTFLQTGGTTTVVGNYFTGKSSITSNSVLEFSTGAVLEGGRISLWDEAVMNITAPNDLAFSGEITGTAGTKIIKTSTGTLTLSGDEGGFQGLYLQSSGRTLISGKYLVGYSSITGASILELGNGSDLSGGGTIGLWDSGVMNITTEKNLEIAGNIEGDALINKTSSCTLRLSGNDNSRFVGMFIQSSGTTIVGGNYFSGISSIQTSVLELVDGSDITRSRAIYLNRNGILNITSDGLISFGTNQVYGTMANGAVIEKSGSGELRIAGDNGTFGGLFLQSGEITTVSANYFGETSVSSINRWNIRFCRWKQRQYNRTFAVVARRCI